MAALCIILSTQAHSVTGDDSLWDFGLYDIGGDGNFRIHSGLGDGQFAAVAIDPAYNWGSWDPASVFTGDFNGDGYGDIGLFSPNASNNAAFLIRYGDGTGNFSNETSWSWNSIDYPKEKIFTGDFNGDGIWDVGLWNPNNDGKFFIQYGKGNGDFGYQKSWNWGTYDDDKVFTGDFNGDGKWDIGLYNPNPENRRKFVIQYGDGNGQFGNQTDWEWSTGEYDGDKVFTGDFNGDGKWDIGLYNPNENGNIFTRLGDGLGNFPTQQEVWVDQAPAQYNPDQVFTGNFNGSCNTAAQCINRILINNGSKGAWITATELLSSLNTDFGHDFSTLYDASQQARPYNLWQMEYQVNDVIYCIPDRNLAQASPFMQNHINQASQVRFLMEDSTQCSNIPVADFTADIAEGNLYVNAEASFDLDTLNVRMATGQYNSCGINTDNVLTCWGDDFFNQVSDLENNHPDETWQSVTGSLFHLCGITTNDQLYCWGKDDNQQVSGIGNKSFWQSVSLGLEHTCGITLAGTLHCWGWNNDNQVSDLENNFAGNTWQAVASGSSHNCGITTTNNMHCWGRDDKKQVSDLETKYAGNAWKAMALGLFHTCGITTEDQLYCWGIDDTQVTGLAAFATNTWQSIATSDDHACGITTQGNLHCWGQDDYKQVSDLENTYPDKTWKSVALGNYHTCGITTQGALHCWGAGDGIGDIEDYDQNQSIVPTGHVWQSVSAGYSHTCGLTSMSEILCWGAGDEDGSEILSFNQSIVPAPHNQPALSYTWDFGDGETASGITANHTYTTGSTGIMLTLSDQTTVVNSTKPVDILTTDLSVVLKGTDGKYDKITQSISYEATVTNFGDHEANNVQLINTLPSQVSRVEFTTSQGSCDSDTAICSLGTITPGQIVAISVVAYTTNDQSMNFYARVETSSAETSLENNSVADQFGGSLGLLMLMALALLILRKYKNQFAIFYVKHQL